MLPKIRKALRACANPEKAAFFPRFFKTGPGQYGEGDVFIGVTVPDTRAVAKECSDVPLGVVRQLLDSKVHEERLCALIILTAQYKKGAAAEKKRIVSFYLANTHRVNNWDLVDIAAEKILGASLLDDQKRAATLLPKLAKSASLWERRIAMVSTLAFIRAGSNDWTFRLAAMLIEDEQDLIQKAAGWMLREAGKRDERALKGFLDEHAPYMGRTALRYAIERLSPGERKRYLSVKRFC